MTVTSSVVEQYSRLADKYDDEKNLRSCWGQVTEKSVDAIRLPRRGLVVDVGCGTGRALLKLAGRAGSEVAFVGLDPAENMRRRAAELMSGYQNARILDGCFENIPLPTGSVDYLYSILAFHWTTDLRRSIAEIARVLKKDGEFDLIFIGRNNGLEFIRKTTPIFLKYMGPALLLESAGLRKQLTRDDAMRLFSGPFPTSDQAALSIDESSETYYDTLEGHWSWWVRIEGQFVKIPAEKKSDCDRDVKQALATLETDRGIPYTIHLLHAKWSRRGRSNPNP